MAKKQVSLKIEIHVDGARETLAMLNRLPKTVNAALRARSFELASTLASKVRNAAISDSKQSALMAPTIKARLDRLPILEAGGAKRLARIKRPAYVILFGSEFGANIPQFRPHLGRGSYWFYRTVYDSQAEIGAAWSKAADDLISDARKDGGSSL